MYILGISCFYHESAACLLKDGVIVAASTEERFSRIKHDPGFPDQAIAFCLEEVGITSAELTYVVFYEKPFVKFSRNLELSLEYFPKSLGFFTESMRNSLAEKLWIKSIICKEVAVESEKVLFVPHHISHAAASYYSSPFKEAAFLTLDGVGEWTTGSWGTARDNKIQPLGEMRFPHSVGLLYSTLTAYLGFEVNDGEYKVMGMAAYGKPTYIKKLKKLYQQNKDGSIELNLKYFAFQHSSTRMYSSLFVKEFTGLNKFNLAASLQKCCEEIVLTMLSYIREKTNMKHLVYGGGVALNSVINGLIIEKSGFEDVFIFPAAGDDGGAVGAAQYVYFHVLGNKKRKEIELPFYGKQFNKQYVRSFLRRANVPYTPMPRKKLITYIAKKLSEGKVIGLFEGRAEFGPRALGHRSILADPRDKTMKDIVNSKIKFREEFRPFAPMVLEEHVSNYFGNTDQYLSRYMLGTFQATPVAIKKAPAVVHVDGSSRIQIIHKNYPGIIRNVLEQFNNKTGVPILLNTSFNVKGEPIVNSPKDAYHTFVNSGLDILVLESCVVEK